MTSMLFRFDNLARLSQCLLQLRSVLVQLAAPNINFFVSALTHFLHRFHMSLSDFFFESVAFKKINCSLNYNFENCITLQYLFENNY